MGEQGVERLWTVQQVAEVLSVKPSTVYDAVYRGVLPVVRLWEGRRRALLRFRRSDVEKLIRDRTVFPSTAAPPSRSAL